MKYTAQADVARTRAADVKVTVGSITRRGRGNGERNVETAACKPPPDGEGTERGARDDAIADADVVDVGDKGGESIGLLSFNVDGDQAASAGRTSIVTSALDGLKGDSGGGVLAPGEVPSSSE